MLKGDEIKGEVSGLFYGKGYGFVESGGIAYFFHAHEARDFERLSVGDQVVFFTEEHERGPRALRLRRVE